MKRSSFFRFISSRVYTAAVTVVHWRENEYIACYFVLGAWVIGKTSHLLLPTKSSCFARGGLEDKSGKGGDEPGAVALPEMVSPSEGSKRWGSGCCLQGLVALEEKAGNILAPKINGKCGWSWGYLPGSKIASASLAPFYYAPCALPAVAVLDFVEWLNRLFGQPLPALLWLCQVSMYVGKAVEVAQLWVGSQWVWDSCSCWREQSPSICSRLQRWPGYKSRGFLNKGKRKLQL